MYPNLRAEMARDQVSNTDIALVIDKTVKAVRDKLAGNSIFTLPEAFAIRDRFFPGLTLEYLFAKEG